MSVLSALACAVLACPAAQRPDVLFILSDDQGYADLGFHEGAVRTPNLDRLRAGGMQLLRHYVQPQCTPTRAALMSGRYPYRLGMHAGVVLPNSDWGMPASTYTLAEMFRDAGYQTALVGKWHLGHRRESLLPEHQGFDFFYGLYLGEVHSYFTHDYFGAHALHSQREPVHAEGYMTDLFSDEAVRVIEEADADRPLFLYLSYNAPHDPLQAKEEDIAKYSEIEYENRRIYLAMIDCMDQGIGRVLDALDRTGRRGNTLIVFTSDNGGVYYREQFARNLPLREGKGGAYEGGIRTPAIAVWDGEIEPGSSSDELVYIADWYPTFMKLAGGRLPKAAPALDGVDAAPVLRGGGGRRKQVPVISHQAHSLVTRDWTLVQMWHDCLDPAVFETMTTDPATLGAELYRIDDDVWQRHDLSRRHPAVFKRMLGDLRRHYRALQPSRFDPAQLEGPYPDDWGDAAIDDL